MEPKGVRMVLDTLKEWDVLTKLESLCSDRDGATNFVLRALAPDIQHFYDAGHIKRSVTFFLFSNAVSKFVT
jgi:hypothetical protein